MRSIFFDWDGTIVDSIGAVYRTDAAVCARFGIPFDLGVFRRTYSPNMRLRYRSLGLTEDRTQDAIDVWSETFRGELREPFSGVVAALARLDAAGLGLGIVTGGDRGEVEPQLTGSGVAELIPVRVYGDDTASGKPHPEPLLLALQRGACAAGDAVYVGDALDDMRMAAAAGVRGVGIVSMIATADDLLAAGASETAESVVEWADRFLRV
jgi:HAD superfamily hydrolase (TIGR01549 family)